MVSERIADVFDWLVDGAPGTVTPLDVLDVMNPGLVKAGLPLHRTEAFVRTLHPHIAGRSFLWRSGEKTTVLERTYAFLNTPEFTRGAIGRVFATGAPLRFRLDGRDGPPPCPTTTMLHDEGYTDFFAGPLTFMSKTVHAITFASRDPRGFSDDDIADLTQVLRPLSRVAEILALARTATNLLNTYVGHDAGERILKGQIQRGDTAELRAVIWFSDLRGFTSMSSRLSPPEIIKVLNELFDCQVPAIEAHGGQVLKFIGDGLLAIFPIGDDETLVGARCDAALAAARDAFARLDVLNEGRANNGVDAVRFGLALHVGDVAYGNIGGAGRLDFTCIGPAVNLAARLEGLTGKLEVPIIASEAFAHATSAKLTEVGTFELKGVPGTTTAYVPGG